MKIAVTYEAGQIFQHFGQTKTFKVYDTENGEIKSEEILGTGGDGHGALAGVLKNAQVEVLICGGIGGGAQQGLNEAGIKFYGGVSGDADKAVKDLLAGSLDYNADATCSGHDGDHHHHHEGGSCGGNCHD